MALCTLSLVKPCENSRGDIQIAKPHWTPGFGYSERTDFIALTNCVRCSPVQNDRASSALYWLLDIVNDGQLPPTLSRGLVRSTMQAPVDQPQPAPHIPPPGGTKGGIGLRYHRIYRHSRMLLQSGTLRLMVTHAPARSAGESLFGVSDGAINIQNLWTHVPAHSAGVTLARRPHRHAFGGRVGPAGARVNPNPAAFFKKPVYLRRGWRLLPRHTVGAGARAVRRQIHYEESHYPMPDVAGIDVLKFLMDEHGLTLSDLPEIGSRVVISDLLAGKRQLDVEKYSKFIQAFRSITGNVYLIMGEGQLTSVVAQ